MSNHTTNDAPILCACGCGAPLPNPKFPSRQRRYLPGHHMRVRKFPRKPLAERFWAKVDRRGPNDCWEWMAYRDKDGYGHIRADHTRHSDTPAHRVSYELAHGPIPDSIFVCHSCDNPACVNPAHLFLGTLQDNVDDMMAKGRGNKNRGEACWKAKLTEQDVRDIRQLYATGGVTMYQLAERYGVGAGPICNIIHRKTWKHVS